MWRNGSVIIDGEHFKASILPQGNMVSPWVARLGGGDPRFNDSEPASVYPIRTFGGGLLKDEGDAVEDVGRIFDSTSWTHIDGRAYLPSAVSSGTLSSANAVLTPIAIIEKGTTVFMYGWAGANDRGLWTLGSAGAWTEVTTASAPGDGVDIIGAAIQGQDFFVAARGADFFRLDNAGTWSNPAAGKEFQAFSSWEDDTLVGARASGNGTFLVEKSTDRGATWTSSVEIYSRSDAPFPMKPFLTADPEGGAPIRVVVIAFVEGVWAVDVANNRAWKIVDWSTEIHQNNGRTMVVGNASADETAVAEALYVSVGRQGILEIHPNGRILDVGLQREDGLPSGRSGIIQGLLSTTNYLIASTGRRGLNGWPFGSPTDVYPSIWIMNKRTRTWHSLWMHTAGAVVTAADATALWITANQNDVNRLYFFLGDIIIAGGDPTSTPTPKYFTFPVGHGDAYELSQISSETSSYIVTPKFDGGFYTLPKLMLSMAGYLRNLAAGSKSVAVRYMLDDGAYTVNSNTGFTLVGTYEDGPRTKIKLFTSGSAPSEEMGITFDNLRLKFSLANSGGSPKIGTGPTFIRWATDYVPVPPRVNAWRVRVYENDIEAPTTGDSGETFARVLERIKWGPTLISFYPDAAETDTSNRKYPSRFFVRPSSITDVRFSNDQSYIELVLSEVTMSQDASEGNDWATLA